MPPTLVSFVEAGPLCPIGSAMCAACFDSKGRSAPKRRSRRKGPQANVPGGMCSGPSTVCSECLGAISESWHLQRAVLSVFGVVSSTAQPGDVVPIWQQHGNGCVGYLVL